MEAITTTTQQIHEVIKEAEYRGRIQGIIIMTVILTIGAILLIF